MRNDFESNYLAHHGILGQRWGHKNGPPYPLDASDHSASEKKAGWRKSLSTAIKDHKKKKQRQKALAKARVARTENLKKEAERQKYEEEKEKALKSGKASEILKYKGDLTNEQLQRAVGRLDWERRLNEISAKEVQTGWDKMDDIMNKVGKVTDYVNKGINAYNAIDRVRKIFDDREKEQKDKEKKAKEEAMEKVVNSRNLNLVKKYAPLMTNKELNAALKGLDYKQELDEDYKPKKQLEKEAAKAEKEARKAEKKEQRKKEKEEERQREIDEFYNGPEWPDDEDDEDKRKRKR